MDIKINCPNCGKHILVDSTAIGQQAACPTCSTPFTIAPASLAVPPSSPQSPTRKGNFRALWLAGGATACILAAALGIWLFGSGKNQSFPPSQPAVGKSGEAMPAERSQRPTDTKLSKHLDKWGMTFDPPPGWINRSAEKPDVAMNAFKAEMFGDSSSVLHADLWVAPNEAATMMVGVLQDKTSSTFSALLDNERAETKAAQRSGVVREVYSVDDFDIAGLDCVVSDVVQANGSRRIGYAMLHQNHVIRLLWLVHKDWQLGKHGKYDDALGGVLQSFAFGEPMGEAPITTATASTEVREQAMQAAFKAGNSYFIWTTDAVRGSVAPSMGSIVAFDISAVAGSSDKTPRFRDRRPH